MAVLGQWVNQQIKHSVLITSGTQASDFLRGFVEPYVQVLENGEVTTENARVLDALFIGTPLGQTVVSVKIWRADGTVLYATTPGLAGRKFVSTDVAQAAEGQIVAEYEDLTSQESAYEQTLPLHLIEVYAPLYRNGTDEVVAVGEVYENADALAAELYGSQFTTWIVVGATTLFMTGVLYLIVRQAETTIAAQRSQLRERYENAKNLAAQNATLRAIADDSRIKASKANEQFLADLGADIHDGPVQLLTLSTLRLTAVSKDIRTGETDFNALERTIEGAVQITQDALTELRNISTGLSLPEIDKLTFKDAVDFAVARHEDITGDKVNYFPSSLPESVNEALKICVYRVIQEGLNNASKHAPNAAKHVQVRVLEDQVYVEVADERPGMPPDERSIGGRSHLGLEGMRNRIEALSGQIEIESFPGRGTHVIVHLPLIADP